MEHQELAARPFSPGRMLQHHQNGVSLLGGGGRRRLCLYTDEQPGGHVKQKVPFLYPGHFRKGEVVRVRSAEEILSTLDPEGTLGGVVFMPEMLKFAGRQFRVRSSAHKTCDGAAEIRAMDHSVHLEGLMCDGGAHDGCQAACPLFWREEWLTPGSESLPAASTAVDEEALKRLAQTTRRTNGSGESVYRCQATDVRLATRPLSQADPRQYLFDLTSGNVSLRTFLVGLVVYAFKKYQQLTERVLPPRLRLRGGRAYPFYQGTGTGERTPIVDVSPGQLVKIREKEEVMLTLGPDNRNRKLWFDAEMVPYCGRTASVNRHVNRIIDETSGKMMKLGDCVVLDDVVCQGIYHRFCPRELDVYWRSAWLRPLDGEDDEDDGQRMG